MNPRRHFVVTALAALPLYASHAGAIPTTSCKEQPRTQYLEAYISKLRLKHAQEPQYAKKLDDLHDSLSRTDTKALSYYTTATARLDLVTPRLDTLKAMAVNLHDNTAVTLAADGTFRAIPSGAVIDVPVIIARQAHVRWEEYQSLEEHRGYAADIVRDIISSYCRTNEIRNSIGPDIRKR